ncbi:MAG: hypothetical protein B0D92_05900 [Spirochaeta sp. LUC14_002_19_P3]|nr:MAG: hypothetical protein B0D92_05900 [Spirochaeta sp. LUC14_002_19_P3]
MKGMITLLFLVTSIGAVYLFSASWYFARAVFDDPFRLWRRQLLWLLLGALAAAAVYRLPRSLIRRSVPALVWTALGLNLLTYLPGIGYQSGGARRWIEIFGLTFQPSEFMRVVLVLYLARMLEKNHGKLDKFWDSLLPPLLIIVVLILSVYFQNDFSTVASLLLISLILFFSAGVSRVAIGLLTFSGFVISAGMLLIKPYRRVRILSWLNPNSDPVGAGYQFLKARTALERGGLWGQGIGQGIMKKGGLPSSHSDFLVAVIGEESGMIGIIIVLLLFTFIALKGWAAAGEAGDLFSYWSIFGLITAVYWQVLVNFAVVSGVLPPTGIPLPLFSAGGSAAFMTLVSFGLILNLARK